MINHTFIYDQYYYDLYFVACPTCARLMTQVKRGRQDQVVFRCPSHKGNKVSPLSGSFFEDSNLPLVKIVGMIFCWAHDMPNHQTVTMVGVSAPTVVTWFKVKNVSLKST